MDDRTPEDRHMDGSGFIPPRVPRASCDLEKLLVLPVAAAISSWV